MNDNFHNDRFLSAFQPVENNVNAKGCDSFFPVVFTNPVPKIVIGMQRLQFVAKAEQANELIGSGVVYGPKVRPQKDTTIE